MAMQMLFACTTAFNAPMASRFNAPVISRKAISPIMSAVDVNKVYRRAEFWEEETCTLLDIVNVLGRWETASDWSDRTKFSVVDSARKENMAQGASVERFEYAKRNGYVERVALEQNVPELSFTNERLASWVGKTVDEMNALPVSKVATSVVYDALAQSKSSLLPEKAVNERRAKWMASDGGLDEGAFMSGMTKSRIAVCVGFFLLGKGQLYGYVLVGRVVLDAPGLFDKAREIAGPFTEPIFWVLTLGAVYLTYQQSAEIARSTANFETLSREEALEKEKTTDRSATVFEKLNKAIYKEE